MKRYLIIALAVMSFISSRGEVVITGKILNYDKKTIISYHPTIEGIFAPYWINVHPKPNGTFLIKFESDGIGVTTLSFQTVLCRLFHDQNSRVFIEIDQSRIIETKDDYKKRYFVRDSIRRLALKSIGGDYSSINKFYNQSLRTAYPTTRLVEGTYYSDVIYHSTSPKQATILHDSLMMIEMDRIDRLFTNISLENSDPKLEQERIKRFLINEVRAFYGGIFLNAMFLKRKEQIFNHKHDSVKTIYNRDWEELIEQFAREVKTTITPSPNSPDYNDVIESLAYTMATYRQYDFPQSPGLIDKLVLDDLENYDTSIFHDRKVAHMHELNKLQIYLNNDLFFSTTLLNAAYSLQQKYPESKNLAFYGEKIEKLKNGLLNAQGDFADARIIRSTEKTFKDLIRKFEGKSLLIDVWATWCPPCIEDFGHKNSIKTFIDNGQIEILYISVDKSEWKDRWLQSIKINQLVGYHYRADNDFKVDMWKTIGGIVGAIPRYVLIDKRGNIVEVSAARPSHGDLLANQINGLLSKSD